MVKMSGDVMVTGRKMFVKNNGNVYVFLFRPKKKSINNNSQVCKKLAVNIVLLK